MAAEPLASIRTIVTIRSALRTARQTVDASETADLDAQVLLAHALNVERSSIFAHGEQVLTKSQDHAFRSALARRATGEPNRLYHRQERLL